MAHVGGVAVEEPVEDVVGLCGGVEGFDEGRIGAEVEQLGPQRNQVAGTGGGQRPAAGLPALHGGLVGGKGVGEILLSEAGGLAGDLEQSGGDEPARAAVEDGPTRGQSE